MKNKKSQPETVRIPGLVDIHQAANLAGSEGDVLVTCMSHKQILIKKVKYIMKEKKLGDTQHNDLQLCFIGGKKGLYLLSYRYQYFRKLKNNKETVTNVGR